MQKELIEMQIVRKAAPHLQVLDNEGFELYAPTDFAEIPALVAQTGRAAQSPMMSLNRNDFTQGNAFWLFLMVDGICVGGCAAHLIDLRDEPFENYLRRSSQALYGRETDPIASVAPPVANEISGRLIYIGELEIHPQFRGKIKALTAFIRVIQALCAMKWPDFDWMYAFIPEGHVKLTGNYGFTWQMPYAIRWNKPVPKGRLDSHWMIGLPRKHFNQLWSCNA